MIEEKPLPFFIRRFDPVINSAYGNHLYQCTSWVRKKRGGIDRFLMGNNVYYLVAMLIIVLPFVSYWPVIVVATLIMTLLGLKAAMAAELYFERRQGQLPHSTQKLYTHIRTKNNSLDEFCQVGFGASDLLESLYIEGVVHKKSMYFLCPLLPIPLALAAFFGPRGVGYEGPLFVIYLVIVIATIPFCYNFTAYLAIRDSYRKMNCHKIQRLLPSSRYREVQNRPIVRPWQLGGTVTFYLVALFLLVLLEPFGGFILETFPVSETLSKTIAIACVFAIQLLLPHYAKRLRGDILTLKSKLEQLAPIALNFAIASREGDDDGIQYYAQQFYEVRMKLGVPSQ